MNEVTLSASQAFSLRFHTLLQLQSILYFFSFFVQSRRTPAIIKPFPFWSSYSVDAGEEKKDSFLLQNNTQLQLKKLF